MSSDPEFNHLAEESKDYFWPVRDRFDTVRGRVIAEGQEIIHGERNQSYGSPTENFTNIGDLWTVHLRNKLKDDESVTALDVSLMMVLLKVARCQVQPKRDNFVDMVGYAGCGWETVGDE